jgi:hypothetical protein
VQDIEIPDKFREYYRIDIKTFNYILDSVKNDLQGYYNFRKCFETEEKPSVALRYVLVFVVRIKINYVCKMLCAVTIQCNPKGNYTRKLRTTLN